ncbi:MAG: quinone-interacting membrane-bound oxidoreductase complex subunit QmoC [Bacteroidota bacterium]|nr:quinone-interacting membrane-bound oxidoreductase complex subunit QmoC [Bacteroidota bacterium]
MGVTPDIGFIRKLMRNSKAPLKQCMQCGNCTVVCELSPEEDPYPRKEMQWAAWGMRDKLLSDPDIWLCHQCGDCSTWCPRGVKPADVLASLRQESIIHYARPKWLGKLMAKPAFLPVALIFPLLVILLILWLAGSLNKQIDPVNYGAFFPHAILNSTFGLLFLISLSGMIMGVRSFYKDLIRTCSGHNPKKSFFKGSFEAMLEIMGHSKFNKCKTHKYRTYAHFLVFWGFIILLFVTFFAILSVMFREYPIPLRSPIKIAGNIAFLMLFTGTSIMIYERLFNKGKAGNTGYFDWVFLIAFYLLIITGPVLEIARFSNWTAGYYWYIVHLVLVWFIIIFLPYTKFAHMIYRTMAIAYLKYSGRK